MAKLFYKSKDGLADLTGNGGDTSKVVGQKYYGTDGEIKGEVFNTYGENGSIASGFNSHAEGRSFAIGDYSHAEGYSDILNSTSEVVPCEIHKMTSEIKKFLDLEGDYSYIIYDYLIKPLKSILKYHFSLPIPVTNYGVTTYEFSNGSGDYFNIAETSIPLGEATYKFVYDSDGEEEECDVDIREVDENERLLFKYLEIDELPRYVDVNDSLPDGELGKLYNTETNELIATITAANYFGDIGFTAFNTDQKIDEGLYYAIKDDNITIQESGAHVGHSHVEGYRSTAMASTAHAEGEYTLASGRGSHAEGYKTQALDSYAHAEGRETQARDNHSHAEGCRTIASGLSSHAEGGASSTTLQVDGVTFTDTVASGKWSHAEGSFTLASGNYSHAENYNSRASGESSHAEGYITTASGEASHAEGYKTEASGQQAHAEGKNTVASGLYAHAEGTWTKAQAGRSHAEGSATEARGQASHAEGEGTIASGDNSHAEGEGTIASGDNSHAEGKGTIATSMGQHAQGRYNIKDTNYKYAMIIGNGKGENLRSNCFTVDWNGFVECAGFVLTSSNGTQYKVTISDDGIFTTTKVE